MPRFQYRYEKILSLKQQLEDQKKLEFGQLRQKIQEENNRLNELKNHLDYKYDEIREKMKGRIHIDKITRLYNDVASIANQIQGQHIFLKELHQQEHVKRKELVEAMKQKKTYETIKANLLVKHNKEETRREQKFLDFICLTNKQRAMD